LPKFPQTCRNVSCLQIFSRKDRKTFFGVTSKKGLHVFLCKPWAPICKDKQLWAPSLPGVSRIFPRFSSNQTFAGALVPLEPQAPTTLLFITVSLVISWFIKIDLKQSYCSYSGTQKIQNVFL